MQVFQANLMRLFVNQNTQNLLHQQKERSDFNGKFNPWILCSQVIYRVLPPNIKFNSPGFNPYSKEVQDLLKTTNLRVTFTKLHTLGDEKLQDTNSINIREKYYYSIYDMIVRGSCSCYGHAARYHPQHKHHDYPMYCISSIILLDFLFIMII